MPDGYMFADPKSRSRTDPLLLYDYSSTEVIAKKTDWSKSKYTHLNGIVAILEDTYFFFNKHSYSQSL